VDQCLNREVKGPGWIGTGAGSALKGFVGGSIAPTSGAHANVQGWNASVLTDVVLLHVAVWSYVVTFGELACGIGLVIGLFTGIAAFGGAFMNLNYLLAGVASTNPVLLLLELLLILAWHAAGYIALDSTVLPLLGAPWQRGPLPKKVPRVLGSAPA
jgi:thiosulfate dehydrogenase [quinone] large subunit